MKKIIYSLLAASLFFVACNNEKKNGNSDKMKDTMSAAETTQERNKKIIKASMDAFMANELDKVFKDAAPSFTDYGDGSGPAINSADSMMIFFKELKKAIPDYKGENIMYLADGNYVAAIGDWSGTFKNDVMGMKATGKMFKFKDVDLFELNAEGKIITHWAVQNFAGALTGSGMSK